MSTRSEHIPVVAIDIGNTKVCAIIAQLQSDAQVAVLGLGQAPSSGLKKGAVVNISVTADAVRRAVKEAEMAAGVSVERAVISVSGVHIKSFNSTGVVAVKRGEVSKQDIDRVIQAARAVPIPQDREIVHVLPQQFRLDGQESVLDPLGMCGVRLEAQAHIVTGATAALQNAVKACELAGVKVVDLILEPLASAQAVLTNSEKELGVALLDIGGGTTDFVLYKGGRVRHSKIFPVAGAHFTNDIAIGFGIPVVQAEQVKKQCGTVSAVAIEQQGVQRITVPLEYEGGAKEIDSASLQAVLCARAEELCGFLAEEIAQYKLKGFMSSGLVITGGGALLKGLAPLLEQCLDVPVRIGHPRYYFSEQTSRQVPEVLSSPACATVYGLISFALLQEQSLLDAVAQLPLLKKVFVRMKSWIHDFL